MDLEMVHGPEVHFDAETGAPRTGRWFWVEISKERRASFLIGELDCRSDSIQEIKRKIADYVDECLRSDPSWAPSSDIQLC